MARHCRRPRVRRPGSGRGRDGEPRRGPLIDLPSLPDPTERPNPDGQPAPRRHQAAPRVRRHRRRHLPRRRPGGPRGGQARGPRPSERRDALLLGRDRTLPQVVQTDYSDHLQVGRFPAFTCADAPSGRPGRIGARSGSAPIAQVPAMVADGVLTGTDRRPDQTAPDRGGREAAARTTPAEGPGDGQGHAAPLAGDVARA